MKGFVKTTAAWILLALLGDNLIAPVVSIHGIAPDFSIIAIVILAMAHGVRAGSVGGFCLGLVQDLAVPTMLGLHALCKTLLGFGVGHTRGRLVYGLLPVEAALVLAAALGHDTLFMLIQSRQQSEVFLGSWFTDALPTAVYTAVVGVPLIRLADLLGIFQKED